LDPHDFAEVLDFWLGAADSPERGRARSAWFRKSLAFDELIRDRFLRAWEAAVGGKLDHWNATPLAALALVVVLDQFPRNMFRGTARAFASDALALTAAKAALENGFDGPLRILERQFFYLPFEHAEDIAEQRRSLDLFARLQADSEGESWMDYPRRHHDIVARFGRFPHRNALLGRISTPQEVAFLAQPGSSF
jgi:uncharacterized protein (DUF924 family)